MSYIITDPSDYTRIQKEISLQRNLMWKTYKSGEIDLDKAKELDLSFANDLKNLGVSVRKRNKKEKANNRRNNRLRWAEYIIGLLPGAKIASIDVEACYTTRKMYEVGVTTVHGTDVTIRNLFYHSKRRKNNFKYGETEFFDSAAALRAEVQRIVDSSDVIVGHSFFNDKKMLGREVSFTDKPIFDTQILAETFPGFPLSLKSLCSRFNIELIGHHCGGNDAYATLKLAFEMAKLVEANLNSRLEETE